MPYPVDREAFGNWWAKERTTPLPLIRGPRAGSRSCESPAWAFLQEESRDAAVARWRRSAREWWFGGAAYPNFWPNLGPGVLAAFLTDYLKFDPVGMTTWFEQSREWEDIPSLALRNDAPWLVRCREDFESLLLHADESVVGVTDIGGLLDVLASLRGTTNLLLDLEDEPERVEQALHKLQKAWWTVFDEQANRSLEVQGGCSSWMEVWSEEPCYPLQCDFSAMIGPAHFERFVMPTLHDCTTRMPRSIYHLDGPGELPHVDQILSLQELDAIQWVPGAGAPPNEDPCWLPLYRRIQQSGKLLILQQFRDPVAGLRLVQQLEEPGWVLMSTWMGEEDGEDLLKMVPQL